MAWYKPWTWGDESQSATDKRGALNETGLAANQFAEYGQGGYQQLGAEAQAARDYLRRQMMGENSLAGEQLRQGLQQNVNAQRSMAASASPQNAAAAARTAAIQAGRLGAGMSGQAAMAGIAERNAAAQAYNNAILGARGQDLNAALGSRQTAVGAYGNTTPEGSTLDKWANPLAGALGAAAKFSDKRLKEDIEDGDTDANKAMKGLRAFTYRYRDRDLGKDREVGIMAQDLEKAGLKHTIIETPRGKAVHGAALSTANTAMLSALEKRVARIESGKK